MNDLVLTAGGTEANGYNTLLMQPNTQASTQLWKVVGKTIRLQDHNICINSPNGATAKLTELDAYTCNGGAAQEWKVTDLATDATIEHFPQTNWVAQC
jgi:hypothetical protein